MLLVLDNYDSFTYNLVQYFGELGAALEIYRNDMITVEEIIDKKPQGIVLSPGPGRPEKAGIMNKLIETAQGNIPILGVCLGHQAIAQVHGAKIGYAPKLMHGKTSEIIHDNSSLFKDINNPFTATRYHSLVVEKQTLSKDFKITAQTKDKVIMGIEHKTLPLYGVQFHPESILTVAGKKILKNYLNLL
ncbi:MAG: aminodeoxychorismate/anthranilate synthase component II [candidate division Zixibacteria bacterium]|nr:aminodeoxychorismate/anthranilate synthase component II [candidate division Zixibacteria bacterium]